MDSASDMSFYRCLVMPQSCLLIDFPLPYFSVSFRLWHLLLFVYKNSSFLRFPCPLNYSSQNFLYHLHHPRNVYLEYINFISFTMPSSSRTVPKTHNNEDHQHGTPNNTSRPSTAGISRTASSITSSETGRSTGRLNSGPKSNDAMQQWLDQDPKQEPWYHVARLAGDVAKDKCSEDVEVRKVWNKVPSRPLPFAV